MHLLLKIFGWIPIPKFMLKPILLILPEKYRENFGRNLLNMITEEDLLPEFVQILLDKLEERGYKKEEGLKYGSTKEEVDASMEKLPQLKPYKIYFMRWCEKKRKEHGLPV